MKMSLGWDFACALRLQMVSHLRHYVGFLISVLLRISPLLMHHALHSGAVLKRII